MRILHLEAGRHFYGGPRQVGYLIDALAGRGCENLLVCASGNALARAANARVFEWRLRGDFDVSLSTRLQRLCRDLEPDLVHVHSRRGADSFGGRAAHAVGIPAVLTRRVQSPEAAVWVRCKCRPYRAIAAISAAVRDELLGCGISTSRVAVIPSGVDTHLFRPDPAARGRLLERYDLPADSLLVGQAAQLIRRKGQDFLIQSVAKLARAEPRLRVLLFGQGALRPRLERRVRRLGLADTIRFCGFAADWPELLPGLDLLLHPARREGLGAVVLEAMSAGVPVVAAAVGGIVDAVEDGVTGRLLPPDAAAEWQTAIVDLLASAGLRSRLGAAARQRIEDSFTIERMVSSYLALYEQVLADAR